MTAFSFFGALDILGTFVFGLSGAMLAIRQRCDLFGVLVLAAATGVAGGILRDVLLGATPPAVSSLMRTDGSRVASSVTIRSSGVCLVRWLFSLKPPHDQRSTSSSSAAGAR